MMKTWPAPTPRLSDLQWAPQWGPPWVPANVAVLEAHRLEVLADPVLRSQDQEAHHHQVQVVLPLHLAAPDQDREVLVVLPPQDREVLPQDLGVLDPVAPPPLDQGLRIQGLEVLHLAVHMMDQAVLMMPLGVLDLAVL